MNTKARLSVLIGTGLVAGLALAGPANAAPAPPPRGQGEAVGYFQSRSDCDWAGRAGDMQNRWDDPNCSMVNNGPLRGWWVLRVDRRIGSQGHPGWPGPGGPGYPGWPGGGH
jgi:hypothetical protein